MAYTSFSTCVNEFMIEVTDRIHEVACVIFSIFFCFLFLMPFEIKKCALK